MSNIISPNADNYTLGKGVVYFAKGKTGGGNEGELDLGNSPNFGVSLDITRLEHFSSRSGLRTKDKDIISELSPGLTFTLDEINSDNIALLFLAESSVVNQVAADSINFQIGASDVQLNRWFDVGQRSAGMFTIAFTGASGSFSEGETITGGTSTATAVVVQEILGTPSTSGTLLIKTIAGGPFQAAETITGGTSTSTATTSAAESFSLSNADVRVAAAVKTQGTDYTWDGKTGRIKILEGGTIALGTAVDIEFSTQAVTYTLLSAFEVPELEGFMRFVSDVPVGSNMELKIWRVSLAPDGEFAMIGEDFSTMSFTGEILKDEAGHPDNPFMEIIMDELTAS